MSYALPDPAGLFARIAKVGGFWLHKQESISLYHLSQGRYVCGRVGQIDCGLLVGSCPRNLDRLVECLQVASLEVGGRGYW